MPEGPDTSALGAIAAELMERLEDVGDLQEDETPRIGVVAVVAEVTVDEADGPGRTLVTYRCSDARSWIQAGLFEQARRAAQEGTPGEPPS